MLVRVQTTSYNANIRYTKNERLYVQCLEPGKGQFANGTGLGIGALVGYVVEPPSKDDATLLLDLIVGDC
jgi:hypothetical protein